MGYVTRYPETKGQFAPENRPFTPIGSRIVFQPSNLGLKGLFSRAFAVCCWKIHIGTICLGKNAKCSEHKSIFERRLINLPTHDLDLLVRNDADGKSDPKHIRTQMVVNDGDIPWYKIQNHLKQIQDEWSMQNGSSCTRIITTTQPFRNF